MSDRVRMWRPMPRLVTVGAVLAVLAVACGGTPRAGHERRAATPRAPTPTEGGSIAYGIEAETVGGWCLPAAQLAAGGTEVAQAVYETLTVPNAKGEYVPYLAKSIDHNADFTQWTIVLRDGISFHDGEPLNASAVVENLDAYRNGPLWRVVFADVADVRAVDRLTVIITTKVPWIALPAFLWGTGRVGIAAPAQLNDPETCARNLIGTGPFKLKSWVPNDSLVVTKNTSYWQKDRSGNPLPYLDQITFVPQEDTAQRVNGLKGSDLDLIHLTDGLQIAGLRNDRDEGLVKLLESDRAAEVSHTMLNVGAPPFDRRSCRLAVAYATDASALNELNGAVTPIARQPYAPKTPGYQRNPRFPGYNADNAERYLDQCTRELGTDRLRFTLDSTPDPPVQAVAGAIRDQLAKAGIEVDLAPPTAQSQYIGLAVESRFQAILWRNFPSTDPDTLYPWLHSTVIDPDTGQTARNPVNFSAINDPVIDQNLERGRSETDPGRRTSLYQDIGRQLAKEAYNVWGWYEDWTFAASPRLNGLQGPTLPNGQSRGLPITSVQPLLGIWIDK
ncbi:MAG: ABC transporter substrate-binding protein [Acidimicrobiia bacterium]